MVFFYWVLQTLYFSFFHFWKIIKNFFRLSEFWSKFHTWHTDRKILYKILKIYEIFFGKFVFQKLSFFNYWNWKKIGFSTLVCLSDTLVWLKKTGLQTYGVCQSYLIPWKKMIRTALEKKIENYRPNVKLASQMTAVKSTLMLHTLS